MTRSVAVATVIAAFVVGPRMLSAQVPLNDDVQSPTEVLALPFQDYVNTRPATTAADDPYCVGQGPTVWYAWTAPADMRVEANTFGSTYDTTLSAYTGAPGALTQLACNDDSGGVQSRIRFDVTAGVQYLLMVGSFASGSGGDLVFTIDVTPALPPLTVEVILDPRGAIDGSTGLVTVGGIARCSTAADVYVSGVVQQKAGGRPIEAGYWSYVFCAGESRWSGQAAAGLRRPRGRSILQFSAGQASVTALAEGYDEGAGTWRTDDDGRTVLLTGNTR